LRTKSLAIRLCKSILFGAVMFVLTFFQGVSIKAQQYAYINNEFDIRIEKSNFADSSLHTGIKPFLTNEIHNFDTLQFPAWINEQNGFLHKFLTNNLLEREGRKTEICINPILTIFPSYELQTEKFYSDYQFGISVGTAFGDKLAFRFDGIYGIRSFADGISNYIDSTGVVPHFGKFLRKEGENYHYLDFNSYISYSPWEYLNIQAGVGKNFFGDGYRSLFLSDNSNSYPFVKATANIWKLKYVWMFGALRDRNSNNESDGLKNKLLFTHFLSWNATKWLNINFFESIVSNPVDSVGVKYFNFNYLNPVIFFRPLEFSGGSADNALLGFGFKVKIARKYQFYGQLILDEFILAEMKSGNNWWGNKYGIQAGVKVFNLFGLNNLFGRIEYNMVRPYTYSYSNSILNYGSYFQALAHPAGANLKEQILLLHYHKNRFSVQGKAVFIAAGMDTDSVSYGKNIYKSYELRQDDYGNTLGQGFSATYSDIELQTGWIMNRKMNLQFLFSINYQKKYTRDENTDRIFLSLGIRSLIQNIQQDFF